MRTASGSSPPTSAAAAAPGGRRCRVRVEERGERSTGSDDRVLGDAVATASAPGRRRVDVVSDGEMSKIGYATYIRHRLSGFELGDVPRATPADLDAYPRFRDRLAEAGGSARYLRPICRGPIAYEHREPLAGDLGQPESRDRRPPVSGAFMNAPSPGIIALFSAQRVLRHAGEYLEAIGEAMKIEYEGDRRGRRAVADRRARPRDGPPHHVPRPLRRGVRRERAAPRRGDQPRAARHPRRPGPAAHLLGQLRGAAPPRHRPREDRRRDPAARSRRRSLFEAANPRHAHEWALARGARSRREGPRPGVIDTTTNYIEHPDLVAQRLTYATSSARPRDGGDRLRVRHLGGIRRRRSGHLLGEAAGARRGRPDRERPGGGGQGGITRQTTCLEARRVVLNTAYGGQHGSLR